MMRPHTDSMSLSMVSQDYMFIPTVCNVLVKLNIMFLPIDQAGQHSKTLNGALTRMNANTVKYKTISSLFYVSLIIFSQTMKGSVCLLSVFI